MLSRRKFLSTAALGAASAMVVPSVLRSSVKDAANDPAATPSKTDHPAQAASVASGAVIDWHAHFLPPRFVEQLRSRSAPPQIVRDKDGKEKRVNEPGSAGQSIRANFTSVDIRLRANDEAGIERQVLSLPGLGGDKLPLVEVIGLAQAFNNGLAEVVAGHPQRFSGLATLPSQDIDFAAHELERAVHELGLLGAILPVDAFLTLPTARELTPILDVAERLGAHLFIHPGTWHRPLAPHAPATPDDGVPYRSSVIELQGRIASAFTTLALSDLLTPYPHVTVQIANLGGAIPFYVDRFHNVAHERNQPEPIAAFRRFYVDTGSQGARSLELAVSVLGADRVLFGTDDPAFSLPDNLREVNAARLNEAEKRQILSENGRSLLAKTQAATIARPTG